MASKRTGSNGCFHALPLLKESRTKYVRGEDSANDSQRPADWKLSSKSVIQPDHLQSHERQHDGQAILQQPKPLNGSGEQEIERTQAQDGQDVRRENNEWLARQGENGRHGIDRKYNIAHFDKQENQ
jgi:hypothetical protein